MSFGRSILLAAARSQRLNDFAVHSSFVKRATRKFLPGESPEDALEAGATIAASGRGLLYTQLGEAITNAQEANAVRDHYLWFLDQIRAKRLPAHVSVKPTQLGLDLSIADCERHLLTLAAKAEQTGSALWVDMEDSSYVDRSLELYITLLKRHPSTGIAMQAYLFRTPADLTRLLPLKPVIRLVKGAYQEPHSIAYAKKADTDRAYFQLASQMLDAARANSCTPIFGTHDLGLIARITEYAAQIGLAKDKYQIHMLYGIRDAAQRQLVADGHVVKTLVSYGSAWFRWYMRRLAERPANLLFVLKSLVA
ncbi:MAG TPA: proline dehydrogenase family protein [Gemmatimonadaceae bacterium]|nr:proline dehydrogenase family protein [Gemmatimonadaceae bacterium]